MVTLLTVAILFTVLQCSINRRTVKSISSKDVHLIDDNGLKHLVPDYSTLLYKGLNNIEILSDEQMNAFPEGAPILPIQDEVYALSKSRGACPCKSYRRSHIEYQSNVISICLLDNKISHDFVKRYSLNNLFVLLANISSPTVKSKCRVIGQISNHTNASFRRLVQTQCPGVCSPVPIMILPSELSILMTRNSTHRRQTCSSTVTTFSFPVSVNAVNVSVMIQELALRRIQECVEKEYWPFDLSFGNHTYSRRKNYNREYQYSKKRLKVGGLVIWIGSQSRLDIGMNQLQSLSTQSQMLTNFDEALSYGQLPIVGWLATEIEYPCRLNTTVCRHMNNYNEYHKYMPNTELGIDRPGWACAQRRPLRALAHLLLLFDPGFILLVDDDTYVNTNFLVPNGVLHQFIHENMSQTNAVIGELHQWDAVSAVGFFLGGAGYLMVKGFIDHITSHNLNGPPHEISDHREENQYQSLSLLRLASAMSSRHCPACVKLNGTMSEYEKYGSTGSTSVRVIDLCSNLFSGENTCYHSDHAISRCIIHGTYSKVITAKCKLGRHGRDECKKLPGLSGHVVGMSQDPVQCDLSIHLTCHRHIPNKSNLTIPVEAGTRRKRVVRVKSNENIYYVDEFNVKHLIQNYDVFLSLGFMQQNIEILTDSQLMALKSGQPLNNSSILMKAVAS